MSKPLTKSQIQNKKYRRPKDKSLEQHLLYRFMNNYGYEKEEITAKVIINDIFKVVELYFLVTNNSKDISHTQYGELVWIWLCQSMSFRKEVNPLIIQGLNLLFFLFLQMMISAILLTGLILLLLKKRD